VNSIRTVSKVIEIKERNKEDLEAEVKKVLELIRMEEELLGLLENTYRDAVEMYEQRQRDPSIRAQELELFSMYFSQLCERIDSQTTAVSKRLAELEEVRGALIETYKDKRLLEILRGKMVKEDVKQRDALAQKEMDFQFLAKRGKK